ncbi:PHP domain-containing protein (plasmid) [Paenibacillus sp. EC2-1]|uniref:PHP domain-containing protein n=1 Tax=Paenibacillus sp. EC2-1 TaxID=3388665 RepID=UPI003BEF25A6
MKDKQKTKKKKVTKRRIVHIHNHSIFSIGDAMCKPDELAKRAVELGIDTIVLTDHGNISGVIQMYEACKKQGVKFIPACEMYEAKDRTELAQAACRDWNKAAHVTMLPVNNQGWEDMQQMIADANKYVYFAPKPIPRTDLDFIESNGLGKNIIATSGCLGSVTSRMIMAGDIDGAKAEILRRQKIFYAYYLEIQDNGSVEQQMVNMELMNISKELDIPLVYAKDVHYIRAEDATAHHTLVAMDRKQSIYECAPYSGTNTYHFASADEVYAWADENNIPHEAIENTWKIADMCDVKLELGKPLMPEYQFCENGYNPASYLRKLINESLIKYTEKMAIKKKKINLKEYIYRHEYEQLVVNDKGFPSYFLSLWDIILWASKRAEWVALPKNREWLDIEIKNKDGSIDKPNAKYEYYPEFLVGPGRGSAAGSMISFLLGITKLDPIEYGFMFERFLNPYRDSPPDIDVDFPGDDHDLLLDFIAQRNGRDRTAQILTFTKLKIRSATDKICKAIEVRDPDNPKKVLSYGYAVADEVKEILELTGDQGKMPDQSDCTYALMMDISVNPHKYEGYDNDLPKFIEASKKFRKLMEKYPELNERLPKIEGCIETSGVHPGGVIISNRPLSLDCPTIMPTEKSKAVLPITMWDFPDCEKVGLLKMDMLRTATLRVISMTINLIRETTGKKIDIYDIGREDPATFETIAKGFTHGLFQINSKGITQYTRQVAPKNQAEVIDILALFRPGPLDAVLENGNTIAQQYVLNGKREAKEYLKEVHPSLRKVFGVSRGQMTYQEQVMHAVQIVAGYNLGHADSFRRVIGKKKISEVKKLYDEFMYGHQYVIEKYEKLTKEYDDMPKFKDKDGNEVVRIKSEFDGTDLDLTRGDINSKLAETKAARDVFEVPGAVNKGYKKKYARSLFKQMAKFAGYAFNKPHSGCYADETFQTAWLKTHYPVQFLTALLTIRAEGADSKNKTLDNLKEAKRLGIRILQPNINESLAGFYPEADGVRFGLQSIAGIGEGVITPILKERDENGPFKSFEDFVDRTSFKGSKVNRGVYRILIRAGCFDCFNPNRHELLNHYNFDIRKDKEWVGSEEELNKDSKKSNHSYRYDTASFTDKRALEMERELIGIYVSGSPYDDLPFTSLVEMSVSTRRDKKMYEVGGRIAGIKAITTRGGKKMAFITMETQLEPMDVTVFPEQYEDFKHHLYRDNIVVIRGYKEKDYRNEENENFICDKVLIKQAKKLKKELGVKEGKIEEEDLQTQPKKPVEDRPKPKADPVADLFEKPKKKRKAG